MINFRYSRIAFLTLLTVELTTSLPVFCFGWLEPLDLKLLKAVRLGNAAEVERVLANDIDRRTGDKIDARYLVEAARRGHKEVVELLIAKGVETNPAYKTRPLEVAAGAGNLEIVKLLIDRGADVNVVYRYRGSPLTAAASRGRVDVMALLIERGANVTPKALTSAAVGGHRDAVNLLIEKGADVNGKDESGRTALIILSERGRKDMAELLVERGANVNASSESGVTALRAAVDNQELDTVELLLDKGADVQAKLADESTPLMGAVLTGNMALVNLLLSKGADVETKLPDGSTALTWAALMDHQEIVSLLRSHGAEMKLPVAAILGDTKEIQRLLDEGADANECQEEGWTPLMRAARKGHVAAVRLLLGKGADVSSQRKDGSTAFLDAVASARVEVMRTLLDSLTETDAKKIDLLPVFRFAAMSDRPDIAGLLLKRNPDLEKRAVKDTDLVFELTRSGSADVLRLLADMGADIHAGTKIGPSIIYAGWSGRTQIVEVLLDRGADVNATETGDQRTVLMNAARDGFIDIVRLLLDRGAKIDARDSGGNTALTEAAKNGHPEIVRLLIHKGADVNAGKFTGPPPLVQATREGKTEMIPGPRHDKTPLVHASRNGNSEAVKILLESGASVDDELGQGFNSMADALEGGHLAVVEMLLDRDAGSTYWPTMLIQSARKGHLGRVQWWLEKDKELFQSANESRFGRPGVTLFPALYFAAAGGHAEIVKLLLSKEPLLVDAQASDGKTVLMRAATKAPIGVVKLILEHKPSVNIKDKYGQTALDYAELRGDHNIVELLKAHGAVNRFSPALSEDSQEEAL